MAARILKPEFKPVEYITAQAQRAFSGEKLSTSEVALMSDVYFQLREQRLRADKEAARLKNAETTAEQVIVQQMRMMEVDEIKGKRVHVRLPPPIEEPHVKDWPKFYAYILKSKDFSLLERRPGKAAVRERWDNGEEVPGIERFPVYKLSRHEV